MESNLTQQKIFKNFAPIITEFENSEAVCQPKTKVLATLGSKADDATQIHVFVTCTSHEASKPLKISRGIFNVWCIGLLMLAETTHRFIAET